MAVPIIGTSKYDMASDTRKDHFVLKIWHIFFEVVANNIDVIN